MSLRKRIAFFICPELAKVEADRLMFEHKFLNMSSQCSALRVRLADLKQVNQSLNKHLTEARQEIRNFDGFFGKRAVGISIADGQGNPWSTNLVAGQCTVSGMYRAFSGGYR